MVAEIKSVELEDGQSADVVSENIERMRELFPDAFSENGVNFDTLRQLLGDESVLDEGEEKYGLNWHGKKKSRQIALTPSTGTLLPCRDESVDWDTTKNLFIEGDNLEVLKLLQKSYANKVKIIYIDPPYNTGKEFIYPDKFQENLDTYLKYTGQVDDEGMKFSSNTETTGRKHTNWLSMMYPRLSVARNLLSQDGVVFISIDENELENLKILCNQIFGEENFAETFIIKSNPRGSQSTVFSANVHEYVVCYVKNSNLHNGFSLPLPEDMVAEYKLEDSRGHYRLLGLRMRGGSWRRTDRPLLYYPVFINPVTAEITLEEKVGFSEVVLPIKPTTGEDGTWRWGKDKINSNLDLLIAKKVKRDGDDVWDIFQKDYLDSEEGEQKGTKPKTIWDEKEVNYQNATVEVKSLFDGKEVFDFPKPTYLVKKILEISGVRDGYVLDFFAGSNTTADAVYQINAENHTNINYITVQLPESLDEKTEAYKQGYRTISEVSLLRLKYAAKVQSNGDLGVKFFRLASSCIRAWNPNRTDLEESLLVHEEHLTEGRTEQDVLYELLLKRGVDLTVPIESHEVVGKNVYSIGYGVLFACLNESISKDEVEDIAQAIVSWHGELAPTSDTHVFFRDSAFRDDVSKTNMAAILEQNGITHVRSL
jgi:adenine-specific DNA-methyltransferase